VRRWGRSTLPSISDEGAKTASRTFVGDNRGVLNLAPGNLT